MHILKTKQTKSEIQVHFIMLTVSCDLVRGPLCNIQQAANNTETN